MSEHEDSSGRPEHAGKCVFCQIIEREAPASIICEGPNTVSFMSLDGYPLIATRTHATNFLDESLEPGTLAEIGQMQKVLATAVSAAYETDSVTIVSANGEASGQEVMHLHVHVMPRVKGDEKVNFKRSPKFPRAELDSLASKLKLELNH